MKYQIMFYGGLVITIITLILAVISFFKLNAAEALCDLVGINLKSKNKLKIKLIKKEKKKEHKINKKNKEYDSTNKGSYKESDSYKHIELEATLDYDTTILDNEGTTLLEDENTTLLDDECTTLIDSEETTIISDEFDETTLLEDDNGFSDSFINEIDIVLINSNKRM